MKALVSNGRGHIKEHIRVCVITKSLPYYSKAYDYIADVFFWNKADKIGNNMLKLAGKYYSCIILDGDFTQEEIEHINMRCK